MIRYWYGPRGRKIERVVRESNRTPHVYIPVDVIREEENYIIKAYVPGVSAEEIDIEIKDNKVVISGEFPGYEGEGSPLLAERVTGAFFRRINMPVSLDAGSADAEVKDGVLTIALAQAEHEKPRQIAVKAG